MSQFKVLAAGHPEKFSFSEDGKEIIKSCSSTEAEMYEELKGDPIEKLVPKIMAIEEDKTKMRMANLLAEYTSPCVMDIKIGNRTFLHDLQPTDDANENYYESVLHLDDEALTSEEKTTKFVTKERYMTIRDGLSSTSSLAFRICGYKRGSASARTGLYTMKDSDKIKDTLCTYVKFDGGILAEYLKQLKEISTILNDSDFFKNHEMVGCSFLLLHDLEYPPKPMVKLIDFGKTRSLKPEFKSAEHHKAAWDGKNQEDGFLIGLENFSVCMEDLVSFYESI